MTKWKSTNQDSIVYPSYNISISTVQLLITVVIRLMLQLQLLYIHSSAVTPYTQCPSVNCVTASDRHLNDSAGWSSSSLKLLTLLGFIIDEPLSAGYSNMQDLQTSVKMNKLQSQCLYHHLPLSWNWETGSKMNVCVCGCVLLSSATCSRQRWHLIIVQKPWLKLWPHAQPVDHSKHHRDP